MTKSKGMSTFFILYVHFTFRYELSVTKHYSYKQFCIHPAHVLRRSFVSEKVGVNQRELNKNDIPIRNRGLT
jgi:hypothetical protein